MLYDWKEYQKITHLRGQTLPSKSIHCSTRKQMKKHMLHVNIHRQEEGLHMYQVDPAIQV